MSLVTDELLRKIVSAGTFRYSVRQMINAFDIPGDYEAEFEAQMEDPKSELYKAYQKGIDKSEYAFDLSLFKAAKEGDIDSIKLLGNRQRANELRSIDEQNIKKYAGKHD